MILSFATIALMAELGDAQAQVALRAGNSVPGYLMLSVDGGTVMPYYAGTYPPDRVRVERGLRTSVRTFLTEEAVRFG